MGKWPTLLAYWTVESLFMAIGDIGVFIDKCFNKIMLLLVLNMVFVCLKETWLADPLGETPGLPAVTTPVDTPANLHCYTSSGELTWITSVRGPRETTYGRDISRSVRPMLYILGLQDPPCFLC